MRNLGAGTSVAAAWAEPARGFLLFRWWLGRLGPAEALALTGQGKDATRPPPRGAGVVLPRRRPPLPAAQLVPHVVPPGRAWSAPSEAPAWGHCFPPPVHLRDKATEGQSDPTPPPRGDDVRPVCGQVGAGPQPLPTA